ncbi:MAG: helix-turn-helix domain-containing protein [Aestuariivita sp.]|nr:helix-turn-helix domain-containing protein [Aestuariivita sp.]MCY4203176.1 helix-turn-helix domain-containing protein [Aestuariivita sp.]MCY4287767.1 helix-turn-helix domain-containing protein [Aestuariivita sp.]MCY4345726.1 helix-turn-helix domain-containing protein [Aestuariivita sp.]
MAKINSDWYGEETATFGDRVAGAREAASMTRTALARRLGVHRDTVVAWEEDRSEPRANKLSMMAGVLNVSIMWLLNGGGEGAESPPIELASAAEELNSIALELRGLRDDLTAAEGRAERLQSRLTLIARSNRYEPGA